MKQVVCKQSELKPGELKVVYINERTAVVVGCNAKQEYFAVRDLCPHQGARLSGGKLTWKTEASEPCQYHVAREGEILRCPWHSFDYDVMTGESIVEKNIKVKTYKVIVDKDYILIDA